MYSQSAITEALVAYPELLKPLSHPLVDEYQKRLLQTLATYLSADELVTVSKACHFGDIAHIKDKRKSGEPYITHPIAVAHILADYHVDLDTIIAAILHDTIEDTDVSKEQITEQFNHTVAELVDGVTKLKSSANNKEQDKAATFRKILTATLNDPRVIIVKLADRLHNMSTMAAVRVEKRISTAQETLDFYLPFARVMGLNELADILELLCFENLDEKQYHYFTEQLSQYKLQRNFRQSQIQDYFYVKLQQLHLNGTVHIDDNRVRLFRAFFNQKLNVDALLNQYEITIELENVSACDALFDYVKNRFQIKNNNIKDYIRKPFSGGYQALEMSYHYHNELIKLTLQTSTMFQASRYGALLGDKASLVSQNTLQASLRNMHELVNDDCAQSTINALFDYFDKNKILIFTPSGDMHELPIGATVLDFAYALSQDIGNHAISAVVEQKPLSLATKLSNGQRVEIITAEDNRPDSASLGFVTTAKARQGLQSWLKTQSIEEQISAGKASLQRTSQDRSFSIEQLSEEKWQALFDWQSTTDKNIIYQRIAIGELLPQLVITKLFAHKAHINPFNCISKASNYRTTIITGTKGIELHYANCCNPILGDSIVGRLSSYGLEVHRHRCYTLLKTQDEKPEHVLALDWHEPETLEATQKNLPEPMFSVVLKIKKECDDDDISRVILRLHETNAVVVDIENQDKETLVYLMVTSRNHVTKIMRNLRVLLDFPGVQRLYRC